MQNMNAWDLKYLQNKYFVQAIHCDSKISKSDTATISVIFYVVWL